MDRNLFPAPVPVPLPSSCDGEPAPDRVFPAILPAEFNPPANPKGALNPLPVAASVGEVLAVDEPERGRLALGCGKYPSVRCSDLEDDIIYYSVSATKCLSYLAREMVGKGNVLECIVLRHTQICIPARPCPYPHAPIAKRRTINLLFVALQKNSTVEYFESNPVRGCRAESMGMQIREFVFLDCQELMGRKVETVEETGIVDEDLMY